MLIIHDIWDMAASVPKAESVARGRSGRPRAEAVDVCRRPCSPLAPEHHLRFRLPVADAGLAPPALLLLLVPAVLPRPGQRRAADPPAAKAVATSQ